MAAKAADRMYAIRPPADSQQYVTVSGGRAGQVGVAVVEQRSTARQ